MHRNINNTDSISALLYQHSVHQYWELSLIFYPPRFYIHSLGGSPPPLTFEDTLSPGYTLTYLMKTPEPIGLQGRWLDLLSE